MIKIFKCGEVPKEEIFARSNPTANVTDIVADILFDVRKNGDTAIKKYAEKFDGVTLSSLEVTKAEIDEAFAVADKKFVEVLREAAENIRVFHEQQKRNGF